MLSDSGRASVPSLHGTSVLPPNYGTQRASTTTRDFGALSHGLSTGCLRFMPSSLTTTQNSLPGDGQSFPGGISVYPLSSIGKFPPFGFPFPGAFPGATQFLLFPGPAFSAVNCTSGPHGNSGRSKPISPRLTRFFQLALEGNCDKMLIAPGSGATQYSNRITD